MEHDCTLHIMYKYPTHNVHAHALCLPESGITPIVGGAVTSVAASSVVVVSPCVSGGLVVVSVGGSVEGAVSAGVVGGSVEGVGVVAMVVVAMVVGAGVVGSGMNTPLHTSSETGPSKKFTSLMNRSTPAGVAMMRFCAVDPMVTHSDLNSSSSVKIPVEPK